MVETPSPASCVVVRFSMSRSARSLQERPDPLRADQLASEKQVCDGIQVVAEREVLVHRLESQTGPHRRGSRYGHLVPS